MRALSRSTKAPSNQSWLNLAGPVPRDDGEPGAVEACEPGEDDPCEVDAGEVEAGAIFEADVGIAFDDAFDTEFEGSAEELTARAYYSTRSPVERAFR